MSHILPNILICNHMFNKTENSPPGDIWLSVWHKLVKLAAAFLTAGAFLLPKQPHYTGNETGSTALFQYLNVLAPLKAPCWGHSANSSTTPHYHLMVSVPPPLFFQSARSCLHLPQAKTSVRPEPSGGLLNMRPLGATSSLSVGVAGTLTAKGEIGIFSSTMSVRTKACYISRSSHSRRGLFFLELTEYRSALWGGVQRM